MTSGGFWYAERLPKGAETNRLKHGSRSTNKPNWIFLGLEFRAYAFELYSWPCCCGVRGCFFLSSKRIVFVAGVLRSDFGDTYCGRKSERSFQDKSCRQDFRSFAIPLQMLRLVGYSDHLVLPSLAWWQEAKVWATHLWSKPQQVQWASLMFENFGWTWRGSVPSEYIPNSDDAVCIRNPGPNYLAGSTKPLPGTENAWAFARDSRQVVNSE